MEYFYEFYERPETAHYFVSVCMNAALKNSSCTGLLFELNVTSWNRQNAERAPELKIEVHVNGGLEEDKSKNYTVSDWWIVELNKTF